MIGECIFIRVFRTQGLPYRSSVVTDKMITSVRSKLSYYRISATITPCYKDFKERRFCKGRHCQHAGTKQPSVAQCPSSRGVYRELYLEIFPNSHSIPTWMKQSSFSCSLDARSQICNHTSLVKYSQAPTERAIMSLRSMKAFHQSPPRQRFKFRWQDRHAAGAVQRTCKIPLHIHFPRCKSATTVKNLLLYIRFLLLNEIFAVSTANYQSL